LTIVIPPLLALALTILLCGLALWQGEREERFVALAIILNVGVTQLFRDRSWPNIQLAELVADVLTLALFSAIALRTSKYWPLCAAAFQLLSVMTHVAKLIDPLLQGWAYLTAIIIWTYLILITLAVGTWNSWRRRQHEAQIAGG
jgi:hypothetical protein